MRFLMKLWQPFVGGAGAFGLLVLRVITGGALMFHGWPKIQNPMGWMGPNAPIPGIFQALAAISEFLGGLALIVGLLTPIAAFGLVCTFLVATQAVAGRGAPWISDKPGGASFEPALGYLAVSFMIMLAGPGTLSLDYLLFGRKHIAAKSSNTEL